MCGIAGIYDFLDGTGLKLFTNVGLGYERLSIIDLTTDEQPIHNDD